MVYLENQQTPTFRHNTYLSALNEAKRLAKQFNLKAYILMSIESVELNEFKTERINDDLPF